jgi:hypothetical protein
VGRIKPIDYGIDRLVELGVDINAKDNRGMTALMWAGASNDDPSAMARLVALGADVNARDNNGWTAWMFQKIHKAKILVPFPQETRWHLSVAENDDGRNMVEAIIKGSYAGSKGAHDDPWGDRYSGPSGDSNLMSDIGFDDPDDYGAWLDSR